MLIRCHAFGKKNCEGPEGWELNDSMPWYDPKGKYGGEIEGAISKGYTAQEVINFFRTIEKFGHYAFNKSHAASYALIGILTAWLKFYYPTEFWAAVMTVTDDSKNSKYIRIIKEEGIKVSTPDINISSASFTPLKNKIVFGISKIKSVGEASVVGILEERKKGPFASLEDANSRLPKRILRQNVAFALIKAGAFDFEDQNRLTLLNRFLDIRKDKKTARFKEYRWSQQLCQDMEEEVLGTSITYDRWWDSVKEEKTVKKNAVILKVREHYDKNKKLMAFVELKIENCIISAVMFASHYLNGGGTNLKANKMFLISGKKQNDKLIINKVSPFSLAAV